jgi:Fic family protein
MAAEGDILAKMADYRKAVEAYTKVIQWTTFFLTGISGT